MDLLPYQNFLDQLTKHLKKEDNTLLELFRTLVTDEERAEFCYNNKVIDQHLDSWLKQNISGNEAAKNGDTYIRLKASGNKAYISKQNAHALSLYNQALYHAQAGEETGLVYGNRSAVLLAQNRLEDSLKDIELAASSCYPKPKMWKLRKRKGDVLKKLKRFKESRNEFEEALNLAELHNVPQCEMDRLRKILESLPTVEDTTELPGGYAEKISEGDDSPYGGWSKGLKYGSACIEKKFDTNQGRYVVASREIPAGSVILAEEPYAAVLLRPWYNTHCQHCFEKVSLLVPCDHCSQVCYCSESCRLLSWEKYHNFECGKLDLLEKLGVSRLALRVVITTPLQVLRSFQNVETGDLSNAGHSSSGVYDGGYHSVYHLVANSNCFVVEDSIQYSMAAVMLSKILTRFLFVETPEDRLVVSCLLIRHIQQLVCNAHAITSLSCTVSGKELMEQDQVRIATAIYPTASLLNHSCEPSIVNSFRKNRLLVKTVRKILPGEQIFNCYGPHFRRMDFAERQSVLEQQYFFKCRCIHCLKGLSVDSELNCYTCGHCKHTISIEVTTCRNCGVNCTDRSKYSRIVEETSSETFQNGLSVLADEHDSNVNVKAALKLFHRCLEAQKVVLYEYHKKLGTTYDAMGKCYALLLDYETSVRHVESSLKITEMHYGKKSVEVTNELLKLSDVYMAWVQQLIDVKAKQMIIEHLPSIVNVIQRTLRLVELNKEPGNEDLELLRDRLESLDKLKYLCQK